VDIGDTILVVGRPSRRGVSDSNFVFWQAVFVDYEAGLLEQGFATFCFRSERPG
jgi:hypothetical protein